VNARVALALPERREHAAALAHAGGLPTRRVEDWKYSDLARALGETGFGAATARWATGPLPQGVEAFDLAKPDMPDWVRSHFGAQVPNVLSAASLAAAQGGIALRVRGRIDAPLGIEFSGAGSGRGLLVLEEGASLTLLEGAGAGTRNVGFEIVLGAGATLHHVRMAPVNDDVTVEQVALRLSRDARYDAHFANFGGKLSRLELSIALEGENASANLSGVSVLGGDGHADMTTHIRHLVGQTRSSQLFKKVAAGKSRAVYQGKVTVSPLPMALTAARPPRPCC